MNMKKIPVQLVTGFLGAGKTTLIVQLFEKKPEGENWAILVNEFGRISIDGQTLQSKSSEVTVFEIAGGCICCSAKGYFLENLEKIVRLARFDRIIIEPSGLGGTDHLSEMVRQHPSLELMPVVCLVDITTTGHPKLKRIPLYRIQIQNSDIVLLSKTELLEGKELAEKIADLMLDFPGKVFEPKIVFVSGFPVEKGKTWNKEEKSIPDNKPLYPLSKQGLKEFSLNFPAGQPVETGRLNSRLLDFPSIIRAKGYIYAENGWILFNFSLSGFAIETCLPKEQNELVIILDTADEDNFTVLEERFGELF